MHTHLTTALVLSAYFGLGNAAVAVPGRGGGRGPGRTDGPDEQTSPQVPDQNDPNGPSSGPLEPATGPVWRPDTVDPNEPVPIMAQEDIQMNMGKIEDRLEAVQQVVELHQQIVEAVAQVVSGVLDEPTCTWPEPDLPTCGWNHDVSCHGTEGGSNAPEECTAAEFTPSTTLPTSSFAACTSYAKILSSCAAATTSFYALDATAQASCACYATPATSGCSGTKEAQVTVAPTLAAGVLDDNANACHEYFSVQGYENVAKVLGGKSENGTFLGADFCGNVDRDLKAKSNASTGLAAALSPTEYTDCKGLRSGQVVNGGNRDLGLMQHGHIVLIPLIFMTAFSSWYTSL